MWWVPLLFGCGRSEPAAPSGPTLAERGAALDLAVRRAGRDEAMACEAVQAAVRLAPDWTGPAPLGLVAREGGFEPDWRELSLAVGQNAASTALITVGGVPIALGEAGCADPVRLDRWLLRAPTVGQAPGCMRDALVAALDVRVRQVLSAPCLCTVPSAPPTTRIAEALDQLGLADTAAIARAWPERPTWQVCSEP